MTWTAVPEIEPHDQARREPLATVECGFTTAALGVYVVAWGVSRWRNWTGVPAADLTTTYGLAADDD